MTSAKSLGGGDKATIEYVTSDAGPAGYSHIDFTYRGPSGVVFDITGVSSNAPDAVGELGPWARTGTYELVSVAVGDSAGNYTVYKRDGTVEVQPTFIQKPAASDLDFAAADFQVVNPNEDVTPPTLRDFSLLKNPVVAGEPVVVTYDVTDDLSGIESIFFQMLSPTGATVWLGAPIWQAQAVGPATWLVPLAAAPGVYEVRAIHVVDRAHNSVHYVQAPEYAAGYEVQVYPEGSERPPDPPPLSNAEFTVESPLGGDTSYPQITGIKLLTGRVVHPGDQVALQVSASDEGTGISSIAAVWKDGYGYNAHEFETRVSCSDGPLTYTIENWRSRGVWRLDHIDVYDKLGNWATYFSGGVFYRNGTSTDSGTHNVDFTLGDVELKDGPRSPHKYPENTSGPCLLPADVSLEAGDEVLTFGEDAEINGAITSSSGAVPTPVMALYAWKGKSVRLLGIEQGDSVGRYSKMLDLDHNTKLRTSFFGGAVGSESVAPGLSPIVSVIVRPRLEIQAPAEPILLGEKAAMSGLVTPSDAGGDILLKRLRRGRWEIVRRKSLGESGAFKFSIQPVRAGTYSYRVTRPADLKFGRVRSDVMRLVVLQ